MKHVIIVAITLLSCAHTAAAKDDPILDKQSATQMFSFSSAEWLQNLAGLEKAGIGKSLQHPNGSISLVYRPDPRRGILMVTPSDKKGL